MKVIFSFLLGFAIVYSLILYVQGTTQEDQIDDIETMTEASNVNEEKEEERNERKKEKQLDDDIEGIHQWIGEGIDDLINEYGQADRVDLTPYKYEWWIYNGNDTYLQFGVRDDKIVSVFTNAEKATTPYFSVGDTFQKVNSLLEFKDVVPLHGRYTSHQFELKEEDIQMRPLASIGDIWVQVYFDTVTEMVSSIRYLDQQTLLLHRPYSIVYRGDLPELEPLTDEEWERVQEGQAKQILDLTNHIRKKHNLGLLEWDEPTAKVAFMHSEDMHNEDYFSHTSPTQGELKDRLSTEYIAYQLAAENIAANYADAIEAVEGWLNSEGHRVNLLDERFTHLGVGVYRLYYTQNFITPW